MIIRPIRPEDYDAWRPLWYGYLEFYETSVDDAVYDLTFDRLTSSDHPNQGAFVAEIEGALVGLVHYIIHPHNWKVEDVCYLQDLFVEEKFRGLGVAYSLMTSIYSEADKHKTPTVYWLTLHINIRDRKLYERYGAKTAFIRYNRA